MQQQASHWRILSFKRLYDANHYSIEMRNKQKIKRWIEVETNFTHKNLFN